MEKHSLAQAFQLGLIIGGVEPLAQHVLADDCGILTLKEGLMIGGMRIN